MPNIKIGRNTVSIPDNINSKDSLEKIIKRLKVIEIKQPSIKTATAKAKGGMMKKRKK